MRCPQTQATARGPSRAKNKEFHGCGLIKTADKSRRTQPFSDKKRHGRIYSHASFCDEDFRGPSRAIATAA
jgi:hypothetical protein